MPINKALASDAAVVSARHAAMHLADAPVQLGTQPQQEGAAEGFPPAWPLLFENQLTEHKRVFESMLVLREDIEAVASQLLSCLYRGNKILLCGNGGSACDAQHFAAEMVGRFKQNRIPLAAMALASDLAVLTCVGNDFGFDEIFARQVQALGQRGDCLIAISTSGNSENVVRAVKTARCLGIRTIGLTGKEGRMNHLCEQLIAIPTTSTARIQEAHVFVLHSLCVLMEAQLLSRGYAAIGASTGDHGDGASFYFNKESC